MPCARSSTLLGCLILLGLPTARAASPELDEEVRIGVFDSRALAIAYANSAIFRDSLAVARRQYDRAKVRGHQQTMARVEAEMQARQERLHAQIFDAAPVDDILASFAGDLAKIARAHAVHLIVAKADLAWQEADTPLVDVTDVMVRPYRPDRRTLGWISELPTVDPVPAAPTPGVTAPDPGSGQRRIGTFDSRALALAHAHSPMFRGSFDRARQEHAKAKARGDSEAMQRIEAMMKKLHSQVFSTAPVDDFLASYPGDLTELARAHGACVIVSKWDLAWQQAEAPLVDLTEAMVQPYDLDERTLGWIRDLKTVDPVPPEDMKKGSDQTH